MSPAPFRHPALAVALALLAVAIPSLAPPASAAPPVYVRGAVGYGSTGNTTFRDLDCASTDPPALFGCGDGTDGRPLGARGDFGSSVTFDLAAGVELGARTRVELALVSRPSLELDAQANFLNVQGDQPVHADADSLAAFVNLAVDLGARRWSVQPFVAAGVGVARNEIDDVTYEFPGLGLDAATIIRGGTNTDFAWTAAAGVAWRLTDALALELTARYVDLGEVRTDAGPARIRRAAETFDLDIAGTRADLDASDVTLGLRYRF